MAFATWIRKMFGEVESREAQAREVVRKAAEWNMEVFQRKLSDATARNDLEAIRQCRIGIRTTLRMLDAVSSGQGVLRNI